MNETLVYHSLAKQSGQPTWEEYFIEKNHQNARSIFQSHTCKLNPIKQRDNVSKIAANIFPSNRYDCFPLCLLLTNYETLYN